MPALNAAGSGGRLGVPLHGAPAPTLQLFRRSGSASDSAHRLDEARGERAAVPPRLSRASVSRQLPGARGAHGARLLHGRVGAEPRGRAGQGPPEPARAGTPGRRRPRRPAPARRRLGKLEGAGGSVAEGDVEIKPRGPGRKGGARFSLTGA